MSATNAVERLRSVAGANILESLGRTPGGADASPNLQVGPPPGQGRHVGRNRVKGASQIPPDRIAPDPDQPRREFDPEGLDRLARSLRGRGQLRPIRVRRDAARERWVIIAGERRWRAAVQAGLATIAAVEAAGPLGEDEILEEQPIENCLREDLRPVEQARAYRALMTSRGLSQAQRAERLHVSQGTIAKTRALLDLPGPIQASDDSGEIAPNTAYELSRVEDPAAQATLAHEAAAGRLKRDEIQARARAQPKGQGATRGKAKKVTSRVLRTAAGTRVTVENQRGLDEALVEAALAEALGQVRAARPVQGPEAA